MIQKGMMGYQDLLYIIGSITAIAVVIACLGLLGIAIYAVERRAKEVGVRKVFGASTAGVVGLLAKDFMWLIGIAVALTAPLAWIGNTLLLEQFTYRVEVGPSVLVVGVAAMLLLALAVIGSQALRAAMADPVQTMRYE